MTGRDMISGMGRLGAECSRKSFHVATAGAPLLLLWTGPAAARATLLILALVALLIEALRRTQPGQRLFNRFFSRMLRKAEASDLTGATWLLIGFLISAIAFRPAIAAAAMLFVSISDAAASVVGTRFGRGREKSLPGVLTFLGSAMVIGWLCLPDPTVGTAGAAAATLAESTRVRVGRWRLNDNLMIPLVAGAVMSALA